MKINAKVKFVFWVYIILIFIITCEIGLRFMGFRPDYKAKGPIISVEPKGSFFQPDTIVGYANKPGRFYLHFTPDYTCICTHDSDGNRITEPVADKKNIQNKKSIWIFGCSNTYGWSLNDWQSYPYKLHSLSPEFQIINFGVTGYGTIQSYLKLEHELNHSGLKIQRFD